MLALGNHPNTLARNALALCFIQCSSSNLDTFIQSPRKPITIYAQLSNGIFSPAGAVRTLTVLITKAARVKPPHATNDQALSQNAGRARAREMTALISVLRASRAKPSPAQPTRPARTTRDERCIYRLSHTPRHRATGLITKRCALTRSHIANTMAGFHTTNNKTRKDTASTNIDFDFCRCRVMYMRALYISKRLRVI